MKRPYPAPFSQLPSPEPYGLNPYKPGVYERGIRVAYEDRFVEPVFRALKNVSWACVMHVVQTERDGVTEEEMDDYSDRERFNLGPVSNAYGYICIRTMVYNLMGREMWRNQRFYPSHHFISDHLADAYFTALDFLKANDRTLCPAEIRRQLRHPVLKPLMERKVVEQQTRERAARDREVIERHAREAARDAQRAAGTWVEPDLASILPPERKKFEKSEARADAVFVFHGFDIHNVRRMANKLADILLKLSVDILRYDVLATDEKIETEGLKYAMKKLGDDPEAFVSGCFEEEALGKVVIISGIFCTQEADYIFERYCMEPFVVSLTTMHTKAYRELISNFPYKDEAISESYAMEYTSEEDLDLQYKGLFEDVVDYLQEDAIKDMRERVRVYFNLPAPVVKPVKWTTWSDEESEEEPPPPNEGAPFVEKCAAFTLEDIRTIVTDMMLVREEEVKKEKEAQAAAAAAAAEVAKARAEARKFPLWRLHFDFGDDDY